jgi:hypothetical protein
MKLEGADELRARLDAVAASFPPIGAAWATEAVRLMRQRVHSPRGRMRKSIVGESGARGAEVYGDWRLTFQDKGTKPHDISPKKSRGQTGRTATAVGYGYGTDRAYFRRQVHVRGIKKRPFIRRSAREAFKGTTGAAEIIKAWNLAGGRGGRYVLGDTKARRARARRARAA